MVEPHTNRPTHVHDHMSIHVRSMPCPHVHVHAEHVAEFKSSLGSFQILRYKPTTIHILPIAMGYEEKRAQRGVAALTRWDPLQLHLHCECVQAALAYRPSTHGRLRIQLRMVDPHVGPHLTRWDSPPAGGHAGGLRMGPHLTRWAQPRGQ